MAAAISKGTVLPKPNTNKNLLDDVKEHVQGCACDKCAYFQVTPEAKSVKDGKAVDADGVYRPQKGDVIDKALWDAEVARQYKLAAAQFSATPALGVKEVIAMKSGRGGRAGKAKGPSGVKPVTYRVPFSVGLSNVAGGVVNATSIVFADSNATEWAAFAALYDEYRVMGGRFRFNPAYQAPAGSFGPDAAFFAIAFDPIDGTTASSVRQITESSFHKLVSGQATSIGANSVNVSLSFGKGAGEPYELKWRNTMVQAVTANTTTVSFASGQWKKIAAAGSNGGDGAFKTYGTSDLAGVQVCVSGICVLDVEFRCRT